ncbi:dihydroneopterin aldolase [Rhizobium sp. CB3090]|uniref:dihydroneopterin aldolase n=1 Tax=Rhizobium sp. CB3090 TaxID=3039156 RepID=UPI0024B23424|nr:dihydroneopterin aldolase [Rhizobium sp. CB3090]WFU10739.1 dihydroneopterin aldolase [Rhizobium sp. CB3090]
MSDMIYTITLQNCAFFARHGVHDEEEFLGQRFFVDAELDVEAGDALAQDSIEDTVNYGIAFSVIEEIVTGRRRYLIEALALDVAKELSRRFPSVRRAKITVRKPNAPVPGVLDYVQVSVEHFA